MKTDLAALKSFLTQKAPNPVLVRRAIEAARPVLTLLDAGTYPISSFEKANSPALVQSLKGLLEQAIIITETVTLTLPKGVTPERWLKETWETIDRRLDTWEDQGAIVGGGRSLDRYITDRYFPALLDRLAPERKLEGSLFREFSTCFRRFVPIDNLCALALPKHLAQIPKDGGTLRVNLDSSLHMLFGLALCGFESDFAKLEALVATFEHAIPLGYDENYHWLIPCS